ncbi:MAG: hypothetical protein HC902_07950 [Calothrix sp. SM1_5_4]|nr:hypothetical protein [Calothrix sp. SM1_5_4]
MRILTSFRILAIGATILTGLGAVASASAESRTEYALYNGVKSHQTIVVAREVSAAGVNVKLMMCSDVYLYPGDRIEAMKEFVAQSCRELSSSLDGSGTYYVDLNYIGGRTMAIFSLSQTYVLSENDAAHGDVKTTASSFSIKTWGWESCWPQ